MAQEDEPFEKVYNKIKVLKQRSLEKFNFNEHLIKKGQDGKIKRLRMKSSPLLIWYFLFGHKILLDKPSKI